MSDPQKILLQKAREMFDAAQPEPIKVARAVGQMLRDGGLTRDQIVAFITEYNEADAESEEQPNPALRDPFPKLPEVLKQLGSFVSWSGDVHNKQPFVCGTNRAASYINPNDWTDYATAVDYIQRGIGMPRLGLIPHHGYVALDLDSCRYPETGEIKAWALGLLDLIRKLKPEGTYQHVTPSGAGLRVWVRVVSLSGEKIKTYKLPLSEATLEGKAPQVEVLTTRYATLEGEVLGPSIVAELSAEDWAQVHEYLSSLEVKADKPTTDVELDEGFRLLGERIGWAPLIERMNKMLDARFHGLTLEPGQMTFCPMPQHQPRGEHLRYTPCFGVLRDEPTLVHCFGCDFSGDVIKAIFEFDAGEDGGRIQYKSMYDLARMICQEQGLNFEEFFPPAFPILPQDADTGTPGQIAEAIAQEHIEQESDENDEQHRRRTTLADVRAAVQEAMQGEDRPYKFSHATAAEFFNTLFGRDYTYAVMGKVGEWMKWSGSVWYPVNPNAAVLRMQALVKRIKIEFVGVFRSGGEDVDRAIGEALQDLIKRCSKAEFLNGVMQMFLRLRYKEAEKFDSEEKAHLVNFLNGTYDLRKGEFRDARREDLLTQLLPVAYVPQKRGQHPTWDLFLSQAWPDVRMREFMQRFIGYMLEGTGKEKVALFLHGYGDNGKSIIIEVLMSIFGYKGDSAYGRSLSWDSLRARDKEIRNDLARLHNARGAFCDESQAGMTLDEGIFKALTGMSAMTARFLHKEYFTFFARLAFVLATNRLPKVTGGDDALWSRILKVPMPNKFGKGHPKRIENLKALLASEREAIVMWIIDGYQMYKRDGLMPPQEVVDASREYRQNSDMFEWWFTEQVTPTSNPDLTWEVSTPFEFVFSSYSVWCKQKNEKEQSRDTVMDILRSRGYAVERKRGEMGQPYHVKGLTLNPTAAWYRAPSSSKPNPSVNLDDIPTSAVN